MRRHRQGGSRPAYAKNPNAGFARCVDILPELNPLPEAGRLHAHENNRFYRLLPGRVARQPLPLWIRDPRHPGKFDVKYAWAAKNNPGGMTTQEWCAKFDVQQAACQEELIDRSDCIVVLSPDNPEQHEALSELALKSGKPVYVDKTFAVSRVAAERMFDLAEKHGTPMCSTSMLRYAPELGLLGQMGIAQRDAAFASARGPGIYENYSIHQIEMIVVAMGVGVKRAIGLCGGNASVVLYEYCDGRCSILNHLAWSNFSLAVQDKSGNGMNLSVEGDFCNGFVDALLRFFDTGIPCVPRSETCEAIHMYEIGRKALMKPGVWVT